MGAPLQHALQRFFASAHDRVATDDEIGRRHADTRRANCVLVISNQHVAPSCAAFLRQASRVLRDDAFAFDMRSHSQQLTDSDHACAANTCDYSPPSMLGLGQRGQRQCDLWQCNARNAFGFLLELSAFHRHKAGAKAFQAAGVFVTGVLVDGALTSKFCF